MIWYVGLAMSPIILAPIIGSFYGTAIDKNKKAKGVYLFWCGLILFLMIGLRDKSLGSVDSLGYYENWITLRGMNWQQLQTFISKSDMETGYLFTVWCLSHVIYEPQFVFILSGLLFSFSICRTIYLNSENSMLSMVMSICLGLYIFMVQGLRQSIAISICLLSLELCKKRKLIPFLLTMVLAGLFHRSCIAFVILYFLYGLKFDGRGKTTILIVGIVILLLTPLIVRFGNAFLDKEYITASTGGAVIASLTYVLILGLAFMFLNKSNTNKDLTFFITITVIGAVFYLARYIGTQAMERISFYFLMGQNIVLPSIINKFDKESKTFLSFLVVVLSILLFFYRLQQSYGLVYLFFWQ